MPKMFYGKALFRKRIVFILTAVVLFLVADHLFKGNKKTERISTVDSDPGQIMFHPSASTDMHSKESDSARGYRIADVPNLKRPHQSGHPSDGDVIGIKELQDHIEQQYKNPNMGLACRDALCTNYLSRLEMSALLQCQRNATRKMKRLTRSATGNDARSHLLVSLHRDDTTGALSSGKCRFMEGTASTLT